jgi:ribosomal protein L7Ae-like RNA K-turn-binding protein
MNSDRSFSEKQWLALSALLGFANKAGKLKFGISACALSCRARKARLIILANDLSSNTRKKIEPIIIHNGIKNISLGTKEQFGRLFNRKNTGLVCIEDTGFAAGIAKITA